MRPRRLLLTLTLTVIAFGSTGCIFHGHGHGHRHYHGPVCPPFCVIDGSATVDVCLP